ncbi:hypothetical protein DVK44_17885 [Streptomyces paludis]|uniref:Uncharacterized protein n=1 Tax=Streptomyces paludis TaxID=2282738 RepID=A0A345HR95_9ACTN|nr:hypothetical protein DVK44_17885 [Streptomyces paludis]
MYGVDMGKRSVERSPEAPCTVTDGWLNDAWITRSPARSVEAESWPDSLILGRMVPEEAVTGSEQ